MKREVTLYFSPCNVETVRPGWKWTGVWGGGGFLFQSPAFTSLIGYRLRADYSALPLRCRWRRACPRLQVTSSLPPLPPPVPSADGEMITKKKKKGAVNPRPPPKLDSSWTHSNMKWTKTSLNENNVQTEMKPHPLVLLSASGTSWFI